MLEAFEPPAPGQGRGAGAELLLLTRRRVAACIRAFFNRTDLLPEYTHLTRRAPGQVCAPSPSPPGQWAPAGEPLTAVLRGRSGRLFASVARGPLVDEVAMDCFNLVAVPAGCKHCCGWRSHSAILYLDALTAGGDGGTGVGGVGGGEVVFEDRGPASGVGVPCGDDPTACVRGLFCSTDREREPAGPEQRAAVGRVEALHGELDALGPQIVGRLDAALRAREETIHGRARAGGGAGRNAAHNIDHLAARGGVALAGRRGGGRVRCGRLSPCSHLRAVLCCCPPAAVICVLCLQCRMPHCGEVDTRWALPLLGTSRPGRRSSPTVASMGCQLCSSARSCKRWLTYRSSRRRYLACSDSGCVTAACPAGSGLRPRRRAGGWVGWRLHDQLMPG